ncbi:hypothetical protein KY290_018053 [Solanum tuberosum]|uniref:Uncharacterized protein n=1 Tax=Solanum tuberosum TaxID=4113 RepID=A0ABQ7VFY5_SOLTU|nr:hypothetical protein KY285_017018 [Solanum tuberosum]KAH0761980.1 hypothetical protein KY290_018053 [Solanum tuberosum]
MVMNVNKNQGGKENYKGNKCEYCHYLGHTKDNCYKLIGYPNGWKQKKKPCYGNGNGNMRNAAGTNQFSIYRGQSSGNNIRNQVGPSCSGGFGGGHQSANNISNDYYKPSNTASTSQVENNTLLAKGQTFIEKEYKKIMEMLNKLGCARVQAGDKVAISHVGETPIFDNEVDLYSGKVKGIGREEGGLYNFKVAFTPKQKEEIRCAQKIVATRATIQDTNL